jgi:N-methylhydantoinase A/oxoprolinase/acetone carboxylase beta subunit
VLGGVLSAVGLAGADVRRRRARSLRVRPALASDAPALAAIAETLAAELAELGSELAGVGAPRLELACDLRYEGQSHAIEQVLDVPVAAADGVSRLLAAAPEAFEQEHAVRFGFRLERPVELVAVRAAGVVPGPAGVPGPATDGGSGWTARELQLDGRRARVLDLPNGVLVVPDPWRVVEQRHGCLLLTATTEDEAHG